MPKGGPNEHAQECPTDAARPRADCTTRTIVRHHAFDADAKLGKIGNSSFQESDSTLFALVGPDLDEGDSRGVVDADVDELPTDAKVTIHRARISSSDTVHHGTDATELVN